MSHSGLQHGKAWFPLQICKWKQPLFNVKKHFRNCSKCLRGKASPSPSLSQGWALKFEWGFWVALRTPLWIQEHAPATVVNMAGRLDSSSNGKAEIRCTSSHGSRVFLLSTTFHHASVCPSIMSLLPHLDLLFHTFMFSHNPFPLIGCQTSPFPPSPSCTFLPAVNNIAEYWSSVYLCWMGLGSFCTFVLIHPWYSFVYTSLSPKECKLWRSGIMFYS